MLKGDNDSRTWIEMFPVLSPNEQNKIRQKKRQSNSFYNKVGVIYHIRLEYEYFFNCLNPNSSFVFHAKATDEQTFRKIF
jgi:hypothetical protein